MPNVTILSQLAAEAYPVAGSGGNGHPPALAADGAPSHYLPARQEVPVKGSTQGS